MIVKILLLITIILLTGCASMPGRGGVAAAGQEKKLARAMKYLQQKKLSPAAELLAEVCAQPGVPGVTDEALFRLSLIHLGGQERGGLVRARQDLDRLRREFPASPWAPLAAILSAALADDLSQLRKLKEVNAAVAKENKELRQAIEKLKTLELELGQGSKQ